MLDAVPDNLTRVSGWEAVLIALAGLAAGTINTIVGSGTLITFPVLLALGFPPVTANVSNNIGLVPGGLSGAWGYRRELGGQARTIKRLAPASALGGLAGALLLLVLPKEAFATIVPVLIAIALVLVVLQPRLSRRLAQKREQGMAAHEHIGPAVVGGTFGAGIYGGYFGAAQGVLLVGLLGSLLPEPLQRVNGLKNLLSAIVNGVAAATFVIVRPEAIDWAVVALIAVGSVAGGFVGAGVGRRLPAPVLRSAIIVVGLVAIARLVSS